MRVFTRSDFKEMPWQNGGGVTTELFRLKKDELSFLLRLSVAHVQGNGPFSIFPGIDRILMLLKGKGFSLQGPSMNIILNDETPLYFKGEDPISCTLINGASFDFNVMTDRNFAKSTLTLVKLEENTSKQISSSCHLLFLYDTEEENYMSLKKENLSK